MKLLSAFLIALIAAMAVGSYKLLEPQLAAQGTSVIAMKTVDGKQGGKPYTVLLPNDLTKRQHELLSFAYDVAVRDGHKHPEYVQGIIMQESKAGKMSEWRVANITQPTNMYFGLGQIKLVAAKDVMAKFPELWKFLNTKTDQELQARLIVDDEFNIRVTSKYALMMGVNENPNFAITAYNQGKGGALNIENPGAFDYTRKVKEQAAKMKSAKNAPTPLKGLESPIPSREGTNVALR